jgi:cell division protein ZapA
LAAASERPAVDNTPSQPTAAAAASAPLPADDNQRLQSLVQQLDHVLGEDGRLL